MIWVLIVVFANGQSSQKVGYFTSKEACEKAVIEQVYEDAGFPGLATRGFCVSVEEVLK